MLVLKTMPAAVIDSGYYQTCALTAASKIACLGISSSSPHEETVKGLTAGPGNNCVIKMGEDDGKVYCWGNDSYDISTPPDDVTFSYIDAGLLHVCGILDDQNGQPHGELRCWGIPEDSTSPYNFRQGRVPADLATATFARLSSGLLHTCGILDDQNGQPHGELRCWGIPEDRTFFLNFDQGSVPAELAGMTFASISSGNYHNCGILDGQNGQAAGLLHCWGADFSDQTPVPADLAATPFVDISGGAYHTCGVTTAGRMACWGADARPETPGIQLFWPVGSKNPHGNKLLIYNAGQADPQPPAPGAYAGPPSEVSLSATGLLTWQKALGPQEYQVRWAASESPPEPSEVRWDMLSEQLDVVPESDCAAAESCEYRIEGFDRTMNYLVQVSPVQGLDDADGAWELGRNPLVEPMPTPMPRPRRRPTRTPRPTATTIPAPTATPLPTPAPTLAPTLEPTLMPTPEQTPPAANPTPAPTPRVISKPAEEAVADLGENFVRSFRFNIETEEWTFYDPRAGDANTQSGFIDGERYWILVEESQAVFLNGKLRILTCVDGDCWNLIFW